MGTQIPLKGHSPQFFDHVYCGQRAGWMKTPLGTEVDVDPGHIRRGLSSPAKKAQQLPLFSALSIVATVAHLSYY